MRTQEKLIYTNERGESIEFSPASSYHVNFKDVTGLSDVRNAIYSTNSMGQDGDTYLGYRIESRDIDIVGYIKERDKQAAQNLRRKLNRILNPQYEATLTRLPAGDRVQDRRRADLQAKADLRAIHG